MWSRQNGVMDLLLPKLTGDVGADKAAYRRVIRACRRDLVAGEGPGGRAQRSISLADSFTTWLRRYAASGRRDGGHVWQIASFESLATEPPMAAVNESLESIGATVWVPITLPRGQLRWRRAAEGTSENPLVAQADHLAGSRGVEMLAEFDVLILPALALSSSGYRLGQGGGYYDRAVPLAQQPKASPGAATTLGPPTIGVTYPHEVLPQVPVDSHDIAVDWLVTSDGVTPTG